MSLHQHIISNAIHAQNAPTHAASCFFTSHFCVSRFFVIRFLSSNWWWKFRVSVIHFFSVSLSSLHTFPLSPFIDWCSFKGSRDAGLNQRRTRYIVTQFNNVSVHFCHNFLIKLRQMRRIFPSHLMKLKLDRNWWWLKLKSKLFHKNWQFFLYLFIVFFIRFCVLYFVNIELVSIVWWKTAASVQCVMRKPQNVIVCLTTDHDSATGKEKEQNSAPHWMYFFFSVNLSYACLKLQFRKLANKM